MVFSERAGRYSLSYSDEYYGSYYTFIPHPLCRDLALKIDDELLWLLAGAHRQIGLLEGMFHNINDIENITRLFLLQEAVSSFRIDDAQHFIYPELFGVFSEKKRAQRIVPILNHIQALKYGVDELRRGHLTNNLIYSTHGLLMNHKRGTEITGAVRKKQTILGYYMVSVCNSKTYNPTKPQEIKSCMADIQEYIKREGTIDPLIKTALLHYQLEAIHPFVSGNGKLGRILIAQQLFEAGMLRQTILPISVFLLMEKVEYFDRLDAVHYWGRYEQWIKFFLKALEASAKITLQHMEAAINWRRQYISAIQSEKSDVKYLLEAYRHAEKRIFLNTSSLAEALGVSYNTGARIMNKMVGLGIMKLYKSQARNRMYFAVGFLDAAGIAISSI